MPPWEGGTNNFGDGGGQICTEGHHGNISCIFLSLYEQQKMYTTCIQDMNKSLSHAKYCHNPGQSRTKLSTWSGIKIGKLPPYQIPSTIATT